MIIIRLFACAVALLVCLLIAYVSGNTVMEFTSEFVNLLLVGAGFWTAILTLRAAIVYIFDWKD